VEGVPGPLFSESGRVVVYADQEMARLKAQWLNHLAVRTAVHDVPAECAVRFGEPAQEILAEADAWGAELVVVTTAPWRGFQWIRRGGVADAVFRDAAISVILYHAPSRRALRVGSTTTL
jgi:nucleotide-binding universal stress UspA family protein